MKYRILAKTTLALAAAALLAACGGEDLECGDGTVDQNGQCVPAEEVEDICAEGTTVEDGRCVPDDSVCTGPTSLEDGQCVIQASACNAGTELDPNENICVISDETCSGDTALQVDDDGNTRCVPTDQVCDEGTTFDADTRLCLPDATCQEGDVIVDGVCVSPAQELAGQADIEESENNDPATGGEAQALNLADEQVVFTGTIDAPGEEGVQDVDVFSFEAEAGDWFQLSVQSTGLPTPGFIVEGPAGFLRESYAGGADATAREIVAPESGDYTVTVLPAQLLPSQNGDGPFGDEDWSYVGTAEQVEAPEPADLDLSSGTATLEGSLENLQDNLVEVSGVDAGDIVTVTATSVGTSADGLIQTWADATTFAQSNPLLEGDQYLLEVPDSGRLIALLDWIAADGPDLSFELGVADSGQLHNPSLPTDGAETVTISADHLDVLVVSQTNADDAAVAVEVTDPTGKVIASTDALASGDQLQAIALGDGDYTVELQNDGDDTVEPTVRAYTQQPLDLGAVDADSERAGPAVELLDDKVRFYRFEADADQFIRVSQANQSHDDGFAYELYDAEGALVDSSSSMDARGETSPEFATAYSEDAGEYLLRVRATDPLLQMQVHVESLTPQDVTIPTDGSATSTEPMAFDAYAPKMMRYHAEAGQIVSISHDNDLSAKLSLDVFHGDSGAELVSDSSFWAQSHSSPETHLLYAGSDTTFDAIVSSTSQLTSSVMTFDAKGVDEDLGTADAESTIEPSVNTLNDDETIWLTVDTDTAGRIEFTHENAEGEELAVDILSPEGLELASESYVDVQSDYSPDTVSALAASPDTYVLRLTATDDLSEMELWIDFDDSSTDLGSLTSGETTSATPLPEANEINEIYTFDAPADHIVRVWHDQDGTSSIGGLLYDSTGNLVAEDSYWYPEGSSSGPEYLTAYSSTPATFFANVAHSSSYSSRTDVELKAEAIAPTDLGDVGTGQQSQDNTSTVAEDGFAYYSVTFTEPVILSGNVATPNDENASIQLYNDAFVELEDESGGFENLGLPVGSYIIAVEAGDELPSHTLEIDARPGYTLP